MTTQINDIHDLLRLLEARPDLAAELRQRVLTPELLAMPEQMAVLTARVDGLAEQMAVLTARVDGLAEQVAGLAEQMAVLTARVDGLAEQMVVLTARVDGLAEQVAALGRRLDGVIQELREFKEEQREINRELRELNQRLSQRLDGVIQELREFKEEQREFNGRMEGRVNTLTGQVGNLRGERYERRLKRRLPNLLYSRCGLDDCQLLQDPEENLPPQMLNALREQQRAGEITGEELDHLQEADYIARARGMADGVERYVVVEAALTVDDRDIERARSRADTLDRVTGVATLAMVVGETVNAPQESRAQEHGVTLLLVDS